MRCTAGGDSPATANRRLVAVVSETVLTDADEIAAALSGAGSGLAAPIARREGD